MASSRAGCPSTSVNDERGIRDWQRALCCIAILTADPIFAFETVIMPPVAIIQQHLPVKHAAARNQSQPSTSHFCTNIELTPCELR
jgi:hypothetical protein